MASDREQRLPESLLDALKVMNWRHGRGDITSVAKFDGLRGEVNVYVPTGPHTGFTQRRKFAVCNNKISFAGITRSLNFLLKHEVT